MCPVGKESKEEITVSQPLGGFLGCKAGEKPDHFCLKLKTWG